jgi:phosphoenolpyruvate-protein kinase (PTS system EI component)
MVSLAAVVVDSGGVGSHTAIVAREHGLPGEARGAQRG